ncbi:MAG: NADH-quinone oxidoreductase subunit N [Planctomycetaceae bacterium]|jgi:NADH-quinone oxidoreductase subunit N|nr:NADH-quinone oxidoreductase subunit N [Planctomycetaceae bacterium]MDP7277281.1 NADH-quinone oxidoreductase subunit N [Planctomycetaceae bacterium]
MLANTSIPVFEQLFNELTKTLPGDVFAFLPELVLCGTVIALLLGRLLGTDRWIPGHWTALVGTLIAFGFSFNAALGGIELSSVEATAEISRSELFSGLLINDGMTIFFRLFLLLFLVLVIALTVLSGIPDNEDGPDFYTLLLGATIGMMLMVSANHLLILFLAVEMASVPSYVLVGFLKGRRASSEAALKYVVYGAGAAGVMLYGTSLVAGLLGTAEIDQIAGKLSELTLTGATLRTILLGVMMILVGLAFKLSLVPFHFWCPDAFEGAPAEVGGFLSVASKGAAFALLIRVAGQLAGPAAVPPEIPVPGLEGLAISLAIGLGLVGAASSTFGNLAAYSQTNIKRLLAYSTIAHAGYMLLGVSAMILARHAGDTDLARDCVSGVLFYLTVYLFMNLGAFAIVALVRNQIYSEEIADYKGLAKQAPLLCVAMAVCLFSLVGLPPLGGFVAKFFVLAPVWKAGDIHPAMWLLVGVALLNTVFSLFYYLRILVAMFIDDRPTGQPVAKPDSVDKLYVALVSIPILLLGASPLIGKLSQAAEDAARDLFL